MSHEVYVIYRDGEPIKGKRAAYYTKGDANAAITRFVNDSLYFYRHGEYVQKFEAERKRYDAVPYVAKGVSE